MSTFDAHELREAANAAPVIPWRAETKGKVTKLYAFSSLGEPIAEVHTDDPRVLDYIVKAVNNVELVLDVIDRPMYPDQFRDLTDEEQREAMVQRLTRATEQVNERSERDEKRRRRGLRHSTITNYVSICLSSAMIAFWISQIIVRLNT